MSLFTSRQEGGVSVGNTSPHCATAWRRRFTLEQGHCATSRPQGKGGVARQSSTECNEGGSVGHHQDASNSAAFEVKLDILPPALAAPVELFQGLALFNVLAKRCPASAFFREVGKAVRRFANGVPLAVRLAVQDGCGGCKRSHTQTSSLHPRRGALFREYERQGLQFCDSFAPSEWRSQQPDA